MRWWKLNHTQCRISTPLLFFFFTCGFKEIHALKYVIGAGTGQWSLVIICYCVLPSRLPGPLGLSATSATSTLIAAQGKTFCCSQRNMEGHTDSARATVLCYIAFPLRHLLIPKQWDVKRYEQKTSRKQQLSRAFTVLGRQHSQISV